MQVLKNKYFIGFVILVLLLAIVDWFLFGRTPVNEFQAVKSVVTEKFQTTTQGLKSASSDTNKEDMSETEKQMMSEDQKINPFNPATASLEQFRVWLNSESKSLRHYNVNAEALEQKYQSLASNMTKEQFKLLSEIAQSAESKIDDKIMAAYMLGYAGQESYSLLSDVITSEYHLSGKVQAHSAPEIEQTRERAIRVVLIDRLFSEAKSKDVNRARSARLELQNLISHIRDSYLKNYAQSKLKELSK